MNMDSLNALAWEARRRGTNYGDLVAHLRPGEEAEICLRYAADRKERLRRMEQERQERPQNRRRRRKTTKEGR